MAWTTPRTWTTSELVTASIMNTHVRDNLTAIFPFTAGLQSLFSSTSTSTAAAPGIFTLDTYTTNFYIVSSVTETTIRTFNLSGNYLYVSSKNNVVHGIMGGMLFNNSGSTNITTIKLKYGGTLIATYVFSMANGASLVPFNIDYFVRGNGATNSQIGTINADCGANNVFSAGVLTTATATIDSTSAQAILVSIQFNQNSANTYAYVFFSRAILNGSS